MARSAPINFLLFRRHGVAFAGNADLESHSDSWPQTHPNTVTTVRAMCQNALPRDDTFLCMLFNTATYQTLIARTSASASETLELQHEHDNNRAPAHPFHDNER